MYLYTSLKYNPKYTHLGTSTYLTIASVNLQRFLDSWNACVLIQLATCLEHCLTLVTLVLFFAAFVGLTVVHKAHLASESLATAGAYVGFALCGVHCFIVLLQ